MTTQLQTTRIRFPNTSIDAQGLEECPICPVDWSTTSVRISANNSVTTWNPLGSLEYLDGSQMAARSCKTVEQVFTDGTVKTWLAKPTIEDAMRYSNGGGFFRFHPDGSVESRSYGSTWYWGPLKRGIPHRGAPDTESVIQEVVCCENPHCLCDDSPSEPNMRYSFWTAPE